MKSQPRAGINLLKILGALLEIVEDGGEGAHDGGGAEPVRDHGEVGEVPLDAGLEDRLRVGVAEWRPVLV